jgi:hypothetical protein
LARCVHGDYHERVQRAAVLCLALVSCSAADRPTASPTNSADSGWFVSGGAKGNYRLSLDPAVTHDGKPTTTVQRVADERYRRKVWIA